MITPNMKLERYRTAQMETTCPSCNKHLEYYEQYDKKTKLIQRRMYCNKCERLIHMMAYEIKIGAGVTEKILEEGWRV